jgi:hypothetical protein
MRITHTMTLGAAAAAMLSIPAVCSATLIIEPVFLSTEGSGPAETVLGFYLPDFINPATGEPFLTADEPGEVVTYPAGFPRDEGLAEVVRFYNNTEFDITGFTLVLVGTAIEPEPFNFTVQRDPNVDAVWGDANEDGLIGLSDIFATVTVSEDGRTITFSDGLIPVGGRFTDYIFSTTTDQQPFLAAIDASFSGTRAAVPEPGTLALFGVASLLLTGVRRRKTVCAAHPLPA